MLTFYVKMTKAGKSGQKLNLCKVKGCQEPLLSHFRKPLNGKTRPLKSMGHNQVIQKRCILLPDFIFFIDDTLLHSIFKHWNLEKAHTIKCLKRIGVRICTLILEVTSRRPHLIYYFPLPLIWANLLTALPERIFFALWN